MRNLLHANFRRLWKDKYLWGTCIIWFLACLLSSCDSAHSIRRLAEMGEAIIAEEYFYNSVPMLPMFLGVFISLFLGTEQADGTLRNKLTVGKPRSSVYLASFFTCFAGSLILQFFWFLGSIIFLPLSGMPLEYGWGSVCVIIVLMLGTEAVFTAMYTLIGNLCTNKALTVVYSLIVFGVTLMTSSGIYDRLCESEFTSPAMVFVNAVPVPQETTPNPLYLSGNIRKLYQAILELLPTGQGVLIANVEVIHPVRMLVFSIVLTIMFVLLGVIFFRKKDLK